MAQEKMFTIGKAMRFARKKAKIKQGELAKIVGYGQNAICRWENDKQTPLITAVIDVADALGVSIDELVGRDAIKALPSADVVEVKHGKWIMENYETRSPRGRIIRNKNFKCSNCGRSNGRYNTSYCCGCGAKMYEKEGAE